MLFFSPRSALIEQTYDQRRSSHDHPVFLYIRDYIIQCILLYLRGRVSPEDNIGMNSNAGSIGRISLVGQTEGKNKFRKRKGMRIRKRKIIYFNTLVNLHIHICVGEYSEG